MTRDEFMDVVYGELHSDGDNNRANRIIDAADDYVDEYAQPERIKGWWEVASTGYSGFMRCSACKVGCCGDYRSMNFCPNCGADMRGTKDDERMRKMKRFKK